MRSLRFYVLLIAAPLGVLGCNLTGAISATASPTTQAALPISPTEAVAVPTSTAPVIVAPTPLPTPVIPAGWVTASFPLFGIDWISYAPEYEMLTDETISVDGVRAESPQTLTLFNADPATNFVLSIQNQARNFEMETVSAQAAADMLCIEGITAEPFEMIGWFGAMLYRNTPCGARGSTLLYVFDSYNGHTFYRITVTSPHAYETVEPHVEAILSTVVFTPHPLNFLPPPTP